MSLDFRPEIEWFKGRMIDKMCDPKNLAKPHWETMPQYDLWARALEELEELRKAIMLNQIENVIDECCDVANFCMMIANNHSRQNPDIIREEY